MLADPAPFSPANRGQRLDSPRKRKFHKGSSRNVFNNDLNTSKIEKKNTTVSRPNTPPSHNRRTTVHIVFEQGFKDFKNLEILP